MTSAAGSTEPHPAWHPGRRLPKDDARARPRGVGGALRSPTPRHTAQGFARAGSRGSGDRQQRATAMNTLRIFSRELPQQGFSERRSFLSPIHGTSPGLHRDARQIKSLRISRSSMGSSTDRSGSEDVISSHCPNILHPIPNIPVDIS